MKGEQELHTSRCRFRRKHCRSLWKQRSPQVEKLLDGVPLVIVEDGRPLKERMAKSRVDEDDVLTAACKLQGLERMEQIKYAVLERSGGISIIPKQDKS